jgi:DNA-binding CsgD family transcriptional regulator
MAALEAALEAVRQGEPAAVLIGGEAGMGKTRLIGEFTAAARDAGIRVLTGACLELGADGLPFSPFTAMLRDLVKEVGPSEIARLLSGSGRAARELARLLPEVAADPGPAGAAVPGAGEARAQLFEGLLTLLERLAEQRPLMLVVEDVHWADRSSRDLLAFLIGYQRALRDVLIVATFRSDELHRTHPLRPLLAELARIDWVERIELPRLTRGQAEEFATAVLGHAPDRAVADSIYQRAEGNPLFTEELLACSDGCDMVPDTLADLLLAAVRRLPEPTQEVLRIASAGSGMTSDALLAQVTGYGAAELAAAIRPAVAANVLVTNGDGYSFRHALIQEAVHGDLLPGEHAAVHTRFASAIEQDPGLVSPGRAQIEKAHHWYSAHNTTGALAASWHATVQASNAVAHAERLMLLDRVLELWDQVPDAETRIGASHVRVLEEATAAAADAGDTQRGLKLADLALAELDETTEPVRFALLLRRRHTFRKDLGLDYTQADLERALDLVPVSLSVSARTELLLSAGHCGLDAHSPQYREWLLEALGYAREAGNRTAEAEALANLAMIEAGPGQASASGSEPLRLLTEAHRIAEHGMAYNPLLKQVILESHLLCGAGEFEPAAQAARRGIAAAERHGLARTAGSFLAMNVAEPLWYLGRWDEAASAAERALDLAPPQRTRVGLWIVLGQIALARGDMATAARRAAASRAILAIGAHDDQYHLPQAALDIDLALAAQGAAAAVAVAEDILERYDLSLRSPRYAWPVVVSATTAALQARGDDADALLDRLRSVAEKLEVFGPVQRAWELSFAALAGDVRFAHDCADSVAGTAEDGPDDADVDADAGGLDGRLAAADAAAAAWATLGHSFAAASALVLGARAALANRAGREATTRLRRAQGLARQLGTDPLAAEIDGLMPRAASTGPDADLGLTSRELEVLRLVAAGQSNREIAASLVISPKTASVHVSNILAKLGAASRTEAAVKAHQLALLDVPAQR